jgi:oligoendopeptidase F
VALDERFGHAVDWSGLDDHRAHLWQRQGHLFGNPFYYVEYGIAQLGALGVWARAQSHGRAVALSDYCAGLALGGSRPLPELFQRAGVPFDFSEGAVGGLIDAVERHLAALPD